MSAGGAHSCAVLANGQVWCWGANGDGRLGNGSTSSSAVPVRVTGIATATDVGAGLEHSCALLSNRQIWCWGDGSEGRLGNNSTLNRTVPVQVLGGLGDAVQVSVGYDHNCALRATGNVVCWGDGGAGALGNGDDDDFRVPVAVHSNLPAGRSAYIAAGDDFSCAVLVDGTGFCWGDGENGQLGDGDDDDRLRPVRIVALSSAVDISCGDDHTCASSADGRLSCWGSNLDGQLGIPGIVRVQVPTDLCSR